MSLALSGIPAGIHSTTQDRALGPDGAKLRESIEEAVAPPRPTHRTPTMLENVRVALRKGTDREGVLLNAECFGRMFDVLRAIPSDIPLPEVVVESDDAIGLDWQSGRRQVVSLTVDGSGFVGFAALIGYETHHGRVPFHGDLPRTIADLLRRIFPTQLTGAAA